MPKPNRKKHKLSKLKTLEERMKEVDEVKENLERFGFLDDMEEIELLYSKLDDYVKKSKKWIGRIPLTGMGRIIYVNLSNKKKKPSVVLMKNDPSV